MKPFSIHFQRFANLFAFVPALLFGVFIGGLAGCGDPEAPGTMHVNMMDNFYSPPLARVPVGGHIEFVNKGQNPHNAIAVQGHFSTEKTFGKLEMRFKDRTTVNFPEPGVFPFYCSYHALPDASFGMVGNAVVGDVEFKPTKKGKSWTEAKTWSGVTRNVPGTYPTIQNAVDAAAPGDLILIDRGVYKEEVVVTTPSLVLRGVDRNAVIIDGEFVRGNGIMVVGANGVAIENMTARNATLNGFFWTGVKGYRGSYLTAVNNGDYGLYAFDSTDGVFEHSYGSGSPDSSFYVGQCYPCKAILHDLIAEYTALGYSGTNSGGELYIVHNIFRNSIVGVGPNTLDSELLPPERESTVWGNIVIDNSYENAPIKPLTWPSFGNGIMIAGGIHNRVEKNLIANHPNNGILIIPNLQENFWLSYNNTVRDNVILNSGRADIALVGPVSYGNCFTGNSFASTIPAGLQAFNHCGSPLHAVMGGDLSMLMGALALMLEAKLEIFPHGDYKTQPYPPAQPEMPAEVKSSIIPAHDAFESRKSVIANGPSFHPEAEKTLAAIQSRRARLTGSIQPVIPTSFLTVFFHFFGFLLPFSIYACWTVTALYDIHLSGRTGPAPVLGVIAVPFLGALYYHLFMARGLPRWLRVAILSGGAGCFALFLAVAVVAIVL